MGWTNDVNKRYRNKFFVGFYSWLKGERVFELLEYKGGQPKGKRITFESYQAAKKAGWKKG